MKDVHLCSWGNFLWSAGATKIFLTCGFQLWKHILSCSICSYRTYVVEIELSKVLSGKNYWLSTAKDFYKNTVGISQRFTEQEDDKAHLKHSSQNPQYIMINFTNQLHQQELFSSNNSIVMKVAKGITSAIERHQVSPLGNEVEEITYLDFVVIEKC